MVWNFFAVVDGDGDDPALYPTMSGPDAGDAVEIVESDGSVLWRRATAVRVFGTDAASQLVSLVPLPLEMTWDVLVTDSRVIVSGDTAVVGPAAGAIGWIRAAHRGDGDMLAAHVRYPWIERVLATPKVDRLTSERLRIRVNASAGGAASRFIMMEIELPRHDSALGLAHEISHRAARYRLANDATTRPEDRLRFERLAAGPLRIPSTPSSSRQPTWASYRMPTSYRVNALTAFPRPREPIAPTAAPVLSAEVPATESGGVPAVPSVSAVPSVDAPGPPAVPTASAVPPADVPAAVVPSAVDPAVSLPSGEAPAEVPADAAAEAPAEAAVAPADTAAEVAADAAVVLAAAAPAEVPADAAVAPADIPAEAPEEAAVAPADIPVEAPAEAAVVLPADAAAAAPAEALAVATVPAGRPLDGPPLGQGIGRAWGCGRLRCSLRNQPTEFLHCAECGAPTEPLTIRTRAAT